MKTKTIFKLLIDRKSIWEYNWKNKSQLKILHPNQMIFFKIIKIQLAKEIDYIKRMFQINIKHKNREIVVMRFVIMKIRI